MLASKYLLSLALHLNHLIIFSYDALGTDPIHAPVPYKAILRIITFILSWCIFRTISHQRLSDLSDILLLINSTLLTEGGLRREVGVRSSSSSSPPSNYGSS
jgi:hypothetical protein